MSYESEIVELFEEIPEVKELLAKIRDLEAQIQKKVSEDAWRLVLEWETLWAQYVSLVTQNQSQQQHGEHRNL